MSELPTPRTDEREARSEGYSWEYCFTFARQLERELHESHAREFQLRRALEWLKEVYRGTNNSVSKRVDSALTLPPPPVVSQGKYDGVLNELISVQKERDTILSDAVVRFAEHDKVVAELERAKAAAVPLCVGPPIISILAEHGQYVSNDGQAVIAADGLFKQDPYQKLAVAEEQVKLMMDHEIKKMESDSLVGSCDCLTKSPEVQHHLAGCRYRLISELDAANQDAEALALHLAIAQTYHCTEEAEQALAAHEARTQKINEPA